MTSEEFKKKRDSRTEDLISQIQRHDDTVANIVRSAYERGYADGVNAIMDNDEPSYSNELARLIAFICGQESVKRQYGVWIPVSERLPEINIDVIVTDIETTGTYSARYLGDGIWECDNGTRDDRIIAWMTFPEPYKTEDKE